MLRCRLNLHIFILRLFILTMLFKGKKNHEKYNIVVKVKARLHRHINKPGSYVFRLSCTRYIEGHSKVQN